MLFGKKQIWRSQVYLAIALLTLTKVSKYLQIQYKSLLSTIGYSSSAESKTVFKNIRQPNWKMTKMKDKQKGRQTKWKSTKMENQNKLKMT